MFDPITFLGISLAFIAMGYKPVTHDDIETLRDAGYRVYHKPSRKFVEYILDEVVLEDGTSLPFIHRKDCAFAKTNSFVV